MLGQVVLGYRIIRQIGSGGMGTVYEAVHEGTGQRAAVKILSSQFTHNPRHVERFLAEARATRAMQHTGLVQMFHCDRLSDGTPYILMEYLPGESLGARLSRLALHRERIPLVQILNIVRQTAAAIEVVHRHGVVHRDLKPGNLFLVPDADAPHGERVKVLDFGIAKLLRRSDNGEGPLTTIGSFLGTATYASPEQCRLSGEIEAHADVYSLGVILYQLLCGEPPFVAEHPGMVLSQHLSHEPPPVQDRVPSVPGAVCELVHHMLAKEPAQRPTMEEVVTLVDRALLDVPMPAALSSSSSYGAKGEHVREKGLFLHEKPQPVLGRSPSWLMLVNAALLIMIVGGTLAMFWARHVRGPEQTAAAAALPPLVPAREPALEPAPPPLLLGMSAAFSGPAENLGRGMKIGIETSLHEVNEAGGIAGRKVQLIALDDRYEPDLALQNVQELVERRHVFALIGNVGTPTAKAVLPYVSAHKVLFFGAFTGADILRREPPDRYVFNFRASYAQETSAIVRYFIEVRKIPAAEIAVFAQRDAYGDSGFAGVAKTLRHYGVGPAQILRVGYERNTVDVEKAVEEIRRKRDRVSAIVMVCTYKPGAKFIRMIRDLKIGAPVANVSFVGDLGAELLEYGARYTRAVIVTQVVPPPESGATMVIRYRDLLKRHFPEEHPSFVSLEGYLSSLVLVDSMRRAGSSMTTESLVDTLESIRNLELGIAAPISFSPSQHQAVNRVWGTVIDDKGHYEMLDLQ